MAHHVDIDLLARGADVLERHIARVQLIRALWPDRRTVGTHHRPHRCAAEIARQDQPQMQPLRGEFGNIRVMQGDALHPLEQYFTVQHSQQAKVLRRGTGLLRDALPSVENCMAFSPGA